MPKIIEIIGREILDSRGNPTVEADVVLERNADEVGDGVLGFLGQVGCARIGAGGLRRRRGFSLRERGESITGHGHVNSCDRP